MEISGDKTGDVLTLRLAGRLDVTTAGAFEQSLLGPIESGAHRIIIDLAGLDYVSSAGLRVIVLAGKRLSSVNGRMVFCSLKNPVREVFEIAGFSSLFAVYASHDEATRGLQAWTQ